MSLCGWSNAHTHTSPALQTIFSFERYFGANNQHPGAKQNKTMQNGRRDWAKENTENRIEENLAINVQLLL